ncbi:TPA_asm: maturation protein, partial [ssRNA phage Gerhypos.1_30]
LWAHTSGEYFTVPRHMKGPTPRRLDEPIHTTTVSGTLHDSNPPSGASPDAFPAHTEYSLPYNSMFEYIREESGSRYQWKGVEHYARNTVQPGGTAQQAGWVDYTKSSATDAWFQFMSLFPDSTYYGTQGMSISGVGELGSMDYPVEGLPLLYEEAGLVRSILPDVPFREYVDRSMRAFTPSIKGGISAVNDTIELKDLKSLPHTFKSVQTITNSLGLYFPPRSRWGRLPIGRLVPAVGDVYLQWKFNVFPTLRDIVKTYNAAKLVGKQLAKLNADKDKPIRRRYRAPIVENMGDGTKIVEKSGNVDNFYYCGGIRYDRVTSVGLSVFNATIDYSYKLPSMTPFEQRMLALADFFGLNLNPSIIWNAIPWSFVADWTIGIGQWLDQFTVSNIRPVVFIRRYCASAHVRRVISTYMYPNYGSIHESGPVLCSQVDEQAYKRVANYPGLYSSIVSSGLSPDEIMLTGALVVTR